MKYVAMLARPQTLDTPREILFPCTYVRLVRDLLVKVMFCLIIGSSVTWFGCNSDEVVSSSRNETASYLENKDKEQASQKNNKGRSAPKSIKSKVFARRVARNSIS